MVSHQPSDLSLMPACLVKIDARVVGGVQRVCRSARRGAVGVQRAVGFKAEVVRAIDAPLSSGKAARNASTALWQQGQPSDTDLLLGSQNSSKGGVGSAAKRKKPSVAKGEDQVKLSGMVVFSGTFTRPQADQIGAFQV
jgi:hypothetical protein